MAFAQRSTPSWASRLMVLGDSVVCAQTEPSAVKDANVASKGKPAAGLELESRLITHRHAVEYITRRTAPVSLGAFLNIAKRPRVKDPCRHGRCQSPFRFSAGRHDQRWAIFGGNRGRLWRLVNPHGTNCRAHEHGGDSGWVRSKS